jgi:hypothetical protein
MTTIKPFLTCALAIALVSAFEIAHNHLEKRWSTPGTKDGWTGLFWLLVYSTFMLCGFMPFRPPDVYPWVPFIAISIIHIVYSTEGGGFHLRGTPDHKQPTPSSPARPVKPKIRNIQKLRLVTPKDIQKQ